MPWGQRGHGLCNCNAAKGGHQHQLIPRFGGIDSFTQGRHAFLEKQQPLLGDFSADRGCLCGKIAFHQMRSAHLQRYCSWFLQAGYPYISGRGMPL